MSLILYYCHACGNLLRNKECEKALSLGESINTACCESCAKDGKRVNAAANRKDTPKAILRQTRTLNGPTGLVQKSTPQASTHGHTLPHPALQNFIRQPLKIKAFLAAGMTAAITLLVLAWLFSSKRTTEPDSTTTAPEIPTSLSPVHPVKPAINAQPMLALSSEVQGKDPNETSAQRTAAALVPPSPPVSTPLEKVEKSVEPVLARSEAEQVKKHVEDPPQRTTALASLNRGTVILFGEGSHTAITIEQGAGAIQKQSGQIVAPKVLLFNCNDALGPGSQYNLVVEYSGTADADVKMAFEIDGMDSRSKMVRFLKGQSMRASFTPENGTRSDKKLLKVKIDPRDTSAGELTFHRIYLEPLQ